MDRLLARLERSIGRYAIPNLILYVVGGMGLVWAMLFVRPDVVERLILDMSAVRRGEVWRLVTFLFIPTTTSMYFILFNLYFTWWVGSSLEEHWGTFKFNVYYLVGVLATIVAAVIAGPQANTYLDYSMFLAFAALFPDVTILLFFILPVRVKWLGIATAAYIAYRGITAVDWSTRAAIIASLGNYFLFFSGHWWNVWKSRNLVVRQKARRVEFRANSAVPFGERECAICGAKEADGADIRVCSCDKCGGQARTLCLQHARNH
jgi:membrane associated rhomboid family serine protease